MSKNFKDILKNLFFLCVSICLMLNFSGCFGMKNFTLEERRTAVMQHLEEKYGEKFIEISVEPKGILSSYDTFHMYPESGTSEDRFVACCIQTENGLSIADGYFGVLIHDTYDLFMNELVGEICQDFFLGVSTQPDYTWNERYNSNTTLSELYQKGEEKGYSSRVRIYIKESSLVVRSPRDVLQVIAQKMLEQNLLGSVTAYIVKNDQYNKLVGKTFDEISDLTNNLRDFYIYPEDALSPAFWVYIGEDEESGELMIRHSS